MVVEVDGCTILSFVENLLYLDLLSFWISLIFMVKPPVYDSPTSVAREAIISRFFA